MAIRISVDKSVFNDAYLPHLEDYESRYEVYYGGAGSGKSHFVACKALYKALRSQRKILVIRKYGTTLKDSVFQLMCDLLKAWRLWDYCNVNKSTYTITLPNGSTFLYKGLDDSEKIKSITDITDCWVEEATEITEDDFTQLDTRIRARVEGSQIWLSFNPVSKVNWCYRRFFGPDRHVENTMILWTNYKHNRFLPDSYVKALEAQEKTNPVYYRIYALGEFCSLEKLVLSNWRVEDFDSADIDGQLMIGLDFGFVNDTSALVASIATEDRIYVFREWGATGRTNQELAKVIEGLGFAKSVIVADAAEQKSIEEIRRAGIRRIKPCRKGADSIIHGIQALQNYEIVVHPECTEIATELQNYSWQRDRATGLYVNKPIDAFNHYIDALRYSLQCLEQKKLSTVNKSLLGL